ncbi:MAG: Crp/Fnr family transcriptional regulator [Bacteroidales bacterium]
MKQTDMIYKFPMLDAGAKCFTALPEDQLNKLIDNKQQLYYNKGDMLIKQGGLATTVMFVLKGLIKEYIEGPNGKSTNLRIISSGEFISLSGLFNSKINNYSAMALTDVQVCVIDGRFLSEVILSNNEFGMGLIMRYSQTETHFFTLLRNHLYKQMNGKMADAILYLSAPEYIKENIFTHLSRKDLAEFAAITTENAIRIIKSFEREGFISLRDKNVEILNREALERISQFG